MSPDHQTRWWNNYRLRRFHVRMKWRRERYALLPFHHIDRDCHDLWREFLLRPVTHGPVAADIDHGQSRQNGDFYPAGFWRLREIRRRIVTVGWSHECSRQGIS